MKKVSLVLLILLAGLLLLPGQLFAQYVQENNKNVALAKTQTINGDYFTAGNTVTISGTVNGDAYVAGGTILVDGTINGDLLVAGGTVNVRGTVHNNIRVAGGTINIAGKVGGNITTLGGTITIADNAQVVGSLVSAGGTLDVFGPLGRGATVAGKTVNFGNVVSGDILATSDNLTFSQNASVKGSLTYYGSQNARIASGATISGKVTHNLPPQQPQKKDIENAFSKLGMGFSVVSFLSSLVLGLLFIKFLPVYSLRVTQTMAQRPGRSILVGFIGVIVFPFIFLLLFITIIGIPISLFLLAAYFMLAYLSKLFVALFVGQQLSIRLGYKISSMMWPFVIGLIAFTLLTNIPVLGWIVGFIGFFVGFGAMLLEKKYYYTHLREKKLI